MSLGTVKTVVVIFFDSRSFILWTVTRRLALTGLGRLFAPSSWFIRRENVSESGRSWFTPPDRRGAAPKPQSDDRWAVMLSSTSHWYSNLLHFPRERTPLWEHITALQASPPSPLQALILSTWIRSKLRLNDQRGSEGTAGGRDSMWKRAYGRCSRGANLINVFSF